MHVGIPENRRILAGPDALEGLASLDGTPAESLEWIEKFSTGPNKLAPKAGNTRLVAAYQQELTTALIAVAHAQQERIEALEAQLKKPAKK